MYLLRWFYFIKGSGVGFCTECFSFFTVLMCAYSNFSNLAGETYQQTDAAFLDSEKDNFRDDGSTASTAVLVDNHLYVANVGDSRTVISTAGKGNI
jgi:serine/threonine protein phosphatase PrpC